MTFVVNRAPPGRIKCLHILMKFANAKFDEKDEFNIVDLMYDNSEVNIHRYCDLLTKNASLGFNYCPYLLNPLSGAGCNITNSISFDSTKRKEVSNTINSLDALGFLNRINNKLRITRLGKTFASTKFESPKMHAILSEAVLNYGMNIGVLAQIMQLGKSVFNTSDISVGYPTTNESIIVDGIRIKISTGSQKDSNVRSKSTILAWLTACGFIIPNSLLVPIKNLQLIHMLTLPYIMSKNRSLREYKVVNLPTYIFHNEFKVKKPLEYKNFTKNTGALRENGQKASREATLKFENVIRNRRLALVYLLNIAYMKKKSINITKLINFLKVKPELFVINKEDFFKVMEIETSFAYVCGIPFNIKKGNSLRPLVSVNNKILCKDAPVEVIDYLNKFASYE